MVSIAFASSGNWTIFTMPTSIRRKASSGLRSEPPCASAQYVVAASAVAASAKGQARPGDWRRKRRRVEGDTSRSALTRTLADCPCGSSRRTRDSAESRSDRGGGSTAGAGGTVESTGSAGNSTSGSIEQAAVVVKTASGSVEYVAVETSRMAIARALIVTSPAEVRWAREL